jgi:hypothetical protein
MADLVERYVHQVGLLLPPKERAEIEAELRSQIQDQLEDRYGESPSMVEIASVLSGMGDPRQIAASYNREQYLIGPDLYPYFMLALRHIFVLVPTIVLFLNFFGALISRREEALGEFLPETLIAILQATFNLSAGVVLIFAIIQRVSPELDQQDRVFDPLNLPQIDDPHAVDRTEAVFGSAFGTLVTLVLLYWLQVGGLTLRFNLSDPGDIIPSPMLWMLLLIVATTSMIILQLILLRRNRWNIGLYLTETMLEVFGAICLYFAVTKPFFERLIISNPDLGSVIFIARGPEMIAIIFAVITLLKAGSRLIRLWNYRNSNVQQGAAW